MIRFTLPRAGIVWCTLTWLNTGYAQEAVAPTSTQPAVAFPEAPTVDSPPPPPPPPPYVSPAPQAAPPGPGQPVPGYGPPPSESPPPQPYNPQVYAPQPAPNAPTAPMPMPTYAAAPAEAPYVAPEPEQEIKFPDFSIRVDPLNWLLEGRLGFELEVEAFEWLTIETMPLFVVGAEPILLADNVRQESDGWGPLAGASLSAGFWLEGDSFRGTVLRAGLTSYAYRYQGVGPDGEVVDEAPLSEQRLSFMLGSGRRWGYFTISGGFGLEYELNDERRCLIREGLIFRPTTDGCREGEYIVMYDQTEGYAEDLRGPLFPVEFIFRLSLGFVMDDD